VPRKAVDERRASAEPITCPYSWFSIMITATRPAALPGVTAGDRLDAAIGAACASIASATTPMASSAVADLRSRRPTAPSLRCGRRA